MQLLAPHHAAEVAGGFSDPGESSPVDPALTPTCPVALPPPEC